MRPRLLFRNGLPRYWPVFLPIAIGIGFLALAATAAAPSVSFLMKATRTEGTFIGAITRTGGDHGGSFYHPMFRYHTSDGSIRTFTATGGSTSQTYRDGDRTAVLYDPAQPDRARLASFSELWLGPLAVGVPGLLLAGIGVILLGAFRRRERQEAGQASSGSG